MPSLLPGPQKDTLPLAQLSDVQERATPAPVLKTTRVTDAIALLESAAVTRVYVFVQFDKHFSSYMEVEKQSVIDKLKKIDTRETVICDLDRDGWCWIGARE